MQADLPNPSDIVWRPDAATVAGANLTRFMGALGVESFEALNQRASRDLPPSAQRDPPLHADLQETNA